MPGSRVLTAIVVTGERAAIYEYLIDIGAQLSPIGDAVWRGRLIKVAGNDLYRCSLKGFRFTTWWHIGDAELTDDLRLFVEKHIRTAVDIESKDLPCDDVPVPSGRVGGNG